MATYRVELPSGETYEIETDDKASSAPASLPELPSSVPGTEPKTKTFIVPPGIRKGLDIITTPLRGTRALAVGGANLARAAMPGEASMTPYEALQRAADASKPGFKPQGTAESIAAPLGYAAPLMGVPGLGQSAAAGPVSAMLRAGASVAASGASTAGLSALEQGSETGEIDPQAVKKAGITGAVMGPALRTGAAIVGKVGKVFIGAHQERDSFKRIKEHEGLGHWNNQNRSRSNSRSGRS